MGIATDRLVLYHTPGSCSRVTIAALEELELSFEDRPIDIFKGGQFSPDYRAVNPKAKVPALLVGDALLTETPAILLWLISVDSSEALLPGADPLTRAQAFADLIWCSNTLHPLARAIRMPQRMTTGDPAPVKEGAIATMGPLLDAVHGRLSTQPWWFGARWSIVDVYLSWIVGMCDGGGMDLSGLPALITHSARVRARPNLQRTLAREASALDKAGIVLPGGGTL